MSSSFPWPLLLGTGLMLGLGAPIAKLAAGHGVGALGFALWPTLAAGLVLLALGLRRQGLPAAPRRLLRFSGIAGLFGHALPMSALFWLAAQAGAGFASLSLALPPVFTLAIALLWRLERWNAVRGTAVALGFAGALLLLLPRAGTGAVTAGAVALALAIPLSIGAANVYRSRHLPPGVGTEWLSAGTLLASSAMLLAAGAVRGQAALALPAVPAAWGWVAAQAAVLVIGYQLYFALQRRLEPVGFSFIGVVMTLFGVGAGSLLFGEPLSWTLVPALGLVVAALALLRLGARS